MAGCPFCEVVTHKRIVKLLNLTTISNYCIVIYAVTTLRLGGRYMVVQSLVCITRDCFLCSSRAFLLCSLGSLAIYVAQQKYINAITNHEIMQML